MGELHLDIKVDILKRTYKVDANVGAPQVAYRETITQAESRSTTRTRSRPAAPASSRASSIVFEPNEPGAGFVFEIEDRRRRGAEGIHPRRREGHRVACWRSGVLAGFPVVDVKATLIDGAYHDVELVGARLRDRRARRVCAKALQKGGSVLLEPIMKVEVVTPEEYIGSVIGDLNSRRGQIQGQDMRGNAIVDQRDGAARQHVRLRQQAALDHPGPRELHDAVRSLRAGAGGHRQAEIIDEVRLSRVETRSD